MKLRANFLAFLLALYALGSFTMMADAYTHLTAGKLCYADEKGNVLKVELKDNGTFTGEYDGEVVTGRYDAEALYLKIANEPNEHAWYFSSQGLVSDSGDIMYNAKCE